MLFNQRESITRIVKSVHKYDDPLNNAVIDLETKEVFYSIASAISYVHTRYKKGKAKNSAPTLIIFPGNYLINQTITLDIHGTLLYGVDNVFLEPKKNSNYPLFEIVNNTATTGKGFNDKYVECYFHNIQCDKDVKSVVLKPSVILRANKCKLGIVQESAPDQLEITEHDLILEDKSVKQALKNFAKN